MQGPRYAKDPGMTKQNFDAVVGMLVKQKTCTLFARILSISMQTAP